MKVRQGFVSNSSSTSFLIVGTEMTREIEMKITDYDKKDMGDFFEWGGEYTFGDDLVGYGSDGEPYCIGLWFKDEIINGTKSYAEKAEDLKKIFKKRFDIDLQDNEIDLYYGMTYT